MKLRKAVRADIREIAKVNDISGLSPWSAGSWIDYCDRDEVDFEVLESDFGKVMGFFLSRQVGVTLELFKIAIRSEFRRAGNGTRLLNRCLQLGQSRGCLECILEVRAGDDRAIGFYRAHGFTFLHRRKRYYQGPDEDALVLIRKMEHSQQPPGAAAREGLD